MAADTVPKDCYEPLADLPMGLDKAIRAAHRRAYPSWTALDGRELRLRSQLTAAARGLADCPLGVGDLSRPWRNQGHESRSDESGENDDSSRHIA